MSKNKKFTVINKESERCPKCPNKMQRRTHRADVSHKNKQYYFSEWDYCIKCNHCQLYEKYKVFNKENYAYGYSIKEELDEMFARSLFE